MSNRKALLLPVLVLALAMTTAGCKKQPPVELPPEPPPVEKATPPPEPEKPQVDPGFDPIPKDEIDKPVDLTADQVTAKLRTVFFEFDKHDLGADARRTIEANASVLRDNPKFDVVVHGHCDERGTIEYNLALGERRANAVREYLASLGMSAARVRIVSYGEERPADPGHGESAWAKNRRAEFVVERGN